MYGGCPAVVKQRSQRTSLGRPSGRYCQEMSKGVYLNTRGFIRSVATRSNQRHPVYAKPVYDRALSESLSTRNTGTHAGTH